MKIITIWSMSVTAASVLHTVLPPWEAFADYPRIQKAYKLGIYCIGYYAINARSAAHPSISTADGTKASDASNSNG
jgi:hypothetical protein